MTNARFAQVTPRTVMLVAAGFTVFVFMALILLKYELRYETGELVLTPSGCRAVAAHGVVVTPMEGENLCRVEGDFWFPSNTEKFGVLRFETPQRRIEIQLSEREVVSWAYH